MSLLGVSRLFSRSLRSQLVPAAHVASKPAKHTVTAGEQAIAMTAFFVAILGPSSWVLVHLESYKKKQ